MSERSERRAPAVKAELGQLVAEEATNHPGLGLYMLRPSVVLGPHAVGAKITLPRPLAPIVGWVASRVTTLPVPLPAPVPRLPVQFVHEDDVGQALVLCIVGAGPPGAYNIAGDGVVLATDILRELGLTPVGLPDRLVRAPARTVAMLAALPFAPPAAAWAEVLSHPAIMDTTRAKQALGWRPRYTGLEALRDTLRGDRDEPG